MWNKLWNLKFVILPIVIGALEIIPKSLEKHLNELNVEVKSFKCKPKFYLIVQESSRKSWSSKEKSIERCEVKKKIMWGVPGVLADAHQQRPCYDQGKSGRKK